MGRFCLNSITFSAPKNRSDTHQIEDQLILQVETSDIPIYFAKKSCMVLKNPSSFPQVSRKLLPVQQNQNIGAKRFVSS